MKGVNKMLATTAMAIVLLGGAVDLYAAEPAPDACQALAAQLEVQNRDLRGELRRIQRELAALRVDMDKPGLKEVMAGIGYIFGLFGVAAFAVSRRRK